jgi:hypothetical protein
LLLLKEYQDFFENKKEIALPSITLFRIRQALNAAKGTSNNVFSQAGH